MAREYKDQKNAETEAKIFILQKTLPDFCAGYIRSIAGYTKPLTQLAYLQRIQFFLMWLLDYNVYFNKKYDSIEQFTVQDLDKLKKADFEEFLNMAPFQKKNLMSECRPANILCRQNHLPETIISALSVRYTIIFLKMIL